MTAPDDHSVGEQRATLSASRPLVSDVYAEATTRAVPMTERQQEFEDFVAARYTSLLRTAYLLTQDRGLAEDLVQTTLAKCWLGWRRIEADDPGGYVHRVLVNTYTSWWRRKWNQEYPTENLPHTATTSDTTGQQGVDDRADLGEALRRLPRRMRAVVVLRFYEDLSEADAAAVLGCSVGTVKSQTSRALAKLRIDPALLDQTDSDRTDTPRGSKEAHR